MAVTARASLAHDDLAVMVDGAESGTRVAIVLLALGWSGVVWPLAAHGGLLVQAAWLVAAAGPIRACWSPRTPRRVRGRPNRDPRHRICRGSLACRDLALRSHQIA